MFVPSIRFGNACWYAAGIVAGLCLSGCAALGKGVTMTDPETGETVTTTVGDTLADSVVAASEPMSGVLANIVGTATANPVLGAGAGAALLAALAAGAAKLRPKK
jgi:hypothetical protein